MAARRGILVGCGFFARNHMHAWAQTPGVAIAATCDLDPARAAAAAAEFGIPRHGSDLPALLAEIAPDFVDIATTSPSHRALVERAAAPDRLIIVQKPMADTLSDAAAMVAACDAAGATLLVHENFRWQAPFRAASLRIAGGDVGEVAFARFSFRHGFDVYATQPYLAQGERLAIVDVGPHLFDLAQLYCGPAAAITCQTQRRNPRVRGEDSFAALIAHRNGATSVVDCTFDARLVPHRFPQTTALIEGSAGTIEIGEDYVMTVHGPAGREAMSVDAPVPGWGERPWHVVQDSVAALIGHAAAVMEGRAAPQPSGAFTLGTVALVEAAYASAAEGRRITLDTGETG
jgi:predicted dehydrogenase